MLTMLHAVVAGLATIALSTMPTTASAQQAGPTEAAANAGFQVQPSASASGRRAPCTTAGDVSEVSAKAT